MRELSLKVVKTAGVAFLLYLLLFAGSLRGSFPGVIGSALREVTAILLDPGSQWMAFSCLGIYLAAFLFFVTVGLPVFGEPPTRTFGLPVGWS